MEPEKTPKRIVSKAEYVKISSISFMLSVGSFLSLMLFAILLAPSLLLVQDIVSKASYGDSNFASTFIGVAIGAASLVTALMFLIIRAITAGEKKAKELQHIVPITRATIADMPAPDSLVRASEKPEQAQADVLLRAVTDVQQNAPEQLLRSSIETIETKG